ncbi:Alpha/Beta hydrolase protein [Chaetomium fimeti]|uniref:Alpha/Beta hydrolase protein n=1 Tax=Chaetomium fimeti TaxID=1854472 RepID=A0AAE0LN55_9PEZI|nr:Alpha/Beta hydrolase protein [Chaetomium fimeti]
MDPRGSIVAIHGLNGHWQKSWTNPREKDFLWLRDLLPTKFPGARIMSFEYDARAIGDISPAGVRDHAANLFKLLCNEREDIKDKNRPIVFVVHSLGGIIAKDPMQAEALDISNSTKGIVFFGTPHRGSDTARWAKVVADVVSTSLHRPEGELLKVLQTNSEGLMNVSEDFAPLASRYAIASFYETNVHPVLGTVVVDKASALMALPHEETMMLGGDHSSMCKLGRNDQRWDPVWRAIRRCSRGVSQ